MISIKFAVPCLLMLFLYSCTPKKDQLIKTYFEMREAIEEGNSEVILEYLDEESTLYFETMTDTSYLNIKEASEYGASLGIEVSTAFLANHISSYVKETGDKSAFFQFFTSQYLTPFDFDIERELVKDKTRVGQENYVVLGLNQVGRRYLSWIKFKEINDEFKMDLLYIQRLHEKDLFGQYLRFKKVNNHIPKEEMLETYINSHLTVTISNEKLKAANMKLHYF